MICLHCIVLISNTRQPILFKQGVVQQTMIARSRQAWSSTTISVNARPWYYALRNLPLDVANG